MGDAIGFQGVDERLGDRLLADEIGELLRPVAAGNDRVFRRARRLGGRRFGLPLRHVPPQKNPPDAAGGLSKFGARGQLRRGTPTAQEVVAYGCTFRPDQVHNSPLRGTPPQSPRASVSVHDRGRRRGSSIDFPCLDRDFANHSRLIRPGRTLWPRLLGYCTNHVQARRHFAEDREAAVHGRSAAERDVETAAGRIFVAVLTGPDRARLVLDRVVDLGIEPIAEMADSGFAGSQWAAAFDSSSFESGPSPCCSMTRSKSKPS